MHPGPRSRRPLGSVIVRPPRALGVIVGGGLAAWSFVSAALAVQAGIGAEAEFKTFLAWLVGAVLLLLGLLFANWTYALWALSYIIDRETLTIRWGFREVVIPIDTIQRMVPGRTLDEARVEGLNWWGCHVGSADVKRIGYTLFYSTHGSPDELLYIVTTEESYALTVLDQAMFAEEVQARAALAPVLTHHQRSAATGIAVVDGCNKVIEDLKARAAKTWNVSVDDVVWQDGHAMYAKSDGKFEPLSLKAIAAKRATTGGPIVTEVSVNAGGVGPGFATILCDVEVDPETGSVKVLRFVTAQDVGRAIHPAYVEGQMHGAAAQGIGWALNEEYIYDKAGHLENAGFLDYRIPVASDLPRMDTVIVEVPNPNHPFGAKGVGEACFVPSIAAVANAVSRAVGQRMDDLPMSPPKVLRAIKA